MTFISHVLQIVGFIAAVYVVMWAAIWRPLSRGFVGGASDEVVIGKVDLTVDSCRFGVRVAVGISPAGVACYMPAPLNVLYKPFRFRWADIYERQDLPSSFPRMVQYCAKFLGSKITLGVPVKRAALVDALWADNRPKT